MVSSSLFFFFFNDTATTEIYPLSLHDALPILGRARARGLQPGRARHSHAVRCAGDVQGGRRRADVPEIMRSEEHTSELQSRLHLVCRLLLEKKKRTKYHC